MPWRSIFRTNPPINDGVYGSLLVRSEGEQFPRKVEFALFDMTGVIQLVWEDGPTDVQVEPGLTVAGCDGVAIGSAVGLNGIVAAAQA